MLVHTGVEFGATAAPAGPRHGFGFGLVKRFFFVKKIALHLKKFCAVTKALKSAQLPLYW